MENGTKQHIIQKRKIKSRRRRLKIGRLFVFLLILGLIGWCIYRLCLWGNQTYQTYYAIYENYQLQQELKQAKSPDLRYDDYTNILVLGIDEGTGSEIGQRADTIILLSIDDKDGKMRVLSIPRNTLLVLPGRQKEERINASYYYGGAPLSVQAVSKLLNGITIHQYITINVSALTELIDVLGGIDIYVENDMNYEDPDADFQIHLQKGYQHLNGTMAQEYLRYRGDELGDIGRVQRQQRFVKKLYKKIQSIDTIIKLPALIDILRYRMATSVELMDTAHLIKIIKGLSADTPKTYMLPGSLTANGVDWVADKAGIEAEIDELFPAPKEVSK
ncbi:MAG: LCP family protein [Selenomonadaceae bacterium]